MHFDSLVENLTIDISPFAICEVRRNSCLVLEDQHASSVHYVLTGSGKLQSMSGHEFDLTPGTFVISPPGHCLVVRCGRRDPLSMPTPRCENLPGGWQWLTLGSGVPGVILACGSVKAVYRNLRGIFDLLHGPLVERMADEPMFRTSFLRLLDELSSPRVGTRALTEVLMKDCLISILRRHCEQEEISVPWLATLEHPRLSRAIRAISEQPEAHHTLDGLAQTAGMSRSVFAKRFRTTFGKSPIQLLRETRLRWAQQLLLDTNLPVKSIAHRVGYTSRSHFSRAFKSFAGADPNRYRHEARHGKKEVKEAALQQGPTA